jgi:hypothetical protein
VEKISAPNYILIIFHHKTESHIFRIQALRWPIPLHKPYYHYAHITNYHEPFNDS